MTLLPDFFLSSPFCFLRFPFSSADLCLTLCLFYLIDNIRRLVLDFPDDRVYLLA